MGSTGCEVPSGSPYLSPVLENTIGKIGWGNPEIDLGIPPCWPLIPQRSIFCDIGTEIYDIGTEILYFQCFVTTDMFLFCKPTAFSWNCRICRDLAFGSVKTRFKAILKKLDFSAQIDFCSFLEDAQSFKSQEIRVKLKRMHFVVRPCKPTKN